MLVNFGNTIFTTFINYYCNFTIFYLECFYPETPSPPVVGSNRLAGEGFGRELP